MKFGRRKTSLPIYLAPVCSYDYEDTKDHNSISSKLACHHISQGLPLNVCLDSQNTKIMPKQPTNSKHSFLVFYMHFVVNIQSALLICLAAAMKALNAKGIVHRDLKPQNILLCNVTKSCAVTKATKAADIKLKIGKLTKQLCLKYYITAFNSSLTYTLHYMCGLHFTLIT